MASGGFIAHGQVIYNSASTAGEGYANGVSNVIAAQGQKNVSDSQARINNVDAYSAALDASTKYPWPRAAAPDPHGSHADGSPRSVRKFGVYDDDVPVFDWFRDGVPGERRCIEAQVMDLSDDVAYSVHDLEDGVVARSIDLTSLRDPDVRRAVWATVRDWYLPAAADEELEQVFGELLAMASWPGSPYDGSRRALAALKNLTSDLIGRFCGEVQRATHERYGTRPLTRYAADLIVPRPTGLAIAALKGVAAHFVMRAGDRVAVLAAQRDLLFELLAALDHGPPDLLQPALRADLESAADDIGRRRVLIDQIASLTDPSAVAWHRRLCRRRPG